MQRLAYGKRIVLPPCFDSTPRRGEFPVRINCKPRFSLEILIDFSFLEYPVVDAEFVDNTCENTEFAISSTVQTDKNVAFKILFRELGEVKHVFSCCLIVNEEKVAPSIH